MTPLVLVRGLAYMALPLALGAASIQRRRERGARDAAEEEFESLDYVPRPSRAEMKERRAYLEGGGNPKRIDVRYCRLDKVYLAGARLEGIDLSHASLCNSSLEGSRLSGARLDFADLSKANLRNADLSRASLLETNLWKADLRGANLAGCRGIGMANLRRAQYDTFTSWPNRFNPAGAGAVRAGGDGKTR